MSKAILVRTLVLVACCSIAACGVFGGKRRDAYQGSREGRPLEVPPDLDAPPASRSLVIPAGGEGSADGSVAGESVPPSGGASIEPGRASSLSLRDAPAGAWRRVGLALERSGVGEIVSRDEAAGTYTMRLSVTGREGGFFSRMIGRDKASVEEATRVVRITAEGEGSIVRVEDEAGAESTDAAARKLIAALKQRLG